MNCRQGDLAIIVRSWAGNEGKIVRCVSLSEREFSYPDGTILKALSWVVARELTGWNGRPATAVPDALLRPIRDPGPDEVDEVIQRLGTPHGVTA